MTKEGPNLVALDAQAEPDNEEILVNNLESLQINSVLDELTIRDYKSIFFLLMDFVGEDNFLSVIKQDERSFKQKLNCIINVNNDDSILIEVLGTLKKYKKLKILNTCRHIYENTQLKNLNNINKVWKMFYLLSEELTSTDLVIMKQLLPEDLRNQIETVEEWFFCALQKNIISKTDLTNLERIFHNYPNCVEIIRNFDKPESYDIRTPTGAVNCGIAVIFNFENFKHRNYQKRTGSSVDAIALENVWNLFGFKTEIHKDLTSVETWKQLKHYADMDHSDYDVFVCCFLSHGRSNIIISYDEEEMPIPVLIGLITDTCVTLNSKPKLFFVQACQGTNVQQGFGRPVHNMQPFLSVENFSKFKTLKYPPPITCDVLLAVASIDGYASFRDVVTGSWFIEALCAVLKQKGGKFSILDVMIEVNHRVRNKSNDFGPKGPRNAKQLVNCINTFEKILTLKKRVQ